MYVGFQLWSVLSAGEGTLREAYLTKVLPTKLIVLRHICSEEHEQPIVLKWNWGKPDKHKWTGFFIVPLPTSFHLLMCDFPGGSVVACDISYTYMTTTLFYHRAACRKSISEEVFMGNTAWLSLCNLVFGKLSNKKPKVDLLFRILEMEKVN